METVAKCLAGRPVRVLLAVLGVLSCAACGSYSMYVMARKPPEKLNDAARFYIIRVYMVIFSSILPSAEVGLLSRPSTRLNHMARFITSYLGRGFVYIFMGSLFISSNPISLALGVSLVAVGALNIIATCSSLAHPPGAPATVMP